MFDLFTSRPGIELLSIHIPKTAGTSFRNILKGVYGEQGVVRVDIPIPDEVQNKELCEVLIPRRLSRKARVLHGHFRYNDIRREYKLDSDVPVITWLRNPVDRVISNYFYLQKRLREIMKEKERRINILDRMQRSLMEFARLDVSRNRMTRFLDGRPLEEFLFVGLVEHFSEDLADLAGVLEWRDFEVLHQNSSRVRCSGINEEERAEIRRLNSDDVALYGEAIRIRRARCAASAARKLT